MEEQSKGKAIGLSIASLVVGVAAFAPVLGFVLGIVGLILAKKAKKECALADFSTGIAKGGTIASILGILFSVIFTVVMIFVMIAGEVTINYR